MQKFIRAIGKINYWAIVLLPFSVAIAPGVANTVIGIMAGTFLIEKIARKEKFCSLTPSVIAFLVFMAVGLLTFINTVSVKDSISGMFKLVKFFMIFVVCSENIKGREHFKKIVISIACGISLIGIDALWQLITGKDFIRGNSILEVIGLSRPTASFPNCNVMGVYLTALTPVIAGLAIFLTGSGSRLLLISAALIGSMGIYLSLSRGAGFGFFISVLLLSLAGKKKVVTGLLILLVLVFPFVMPQNIRDWARSVKYNPVILLACETRASLYQNTLNMISKHPFIGVGINTFSKNYGKYKLESVEAVTKTADTIYSHNNFLQMAGEMGLLGLGVFLTFIVLSLRSIWSVFKRNEDLFLKGLSISVFAAIVAYLINGLTETSLYYSRVAMIFWFLIGTGLALTRRE